MQQHTLERDSDVCFDYERSVIKCKFVESIHDWLLPQRSDYVYFFVLFDAIELIFLN